MQIAGDVATTGVRLSKFTKYGTSRKISIFPKVLTYWIPPRIYPASWPARSEGFVPSPSICSRLSVTAVLTSQSCSPTVIERSLFEILITRKKTMMKVLRAILQLSNIVSGEFTDIVQSYMLNFV